MTTRITLAILLTTWAILIVGEAAAFVTARQSMIALLDDTLITRAARILDESVLAKSELPSVPIGDRYDIHSSAGLLLSESNGEGHSIVRPTLVKSAFEIAPDGVRVRTVELRVFVLRGGERVPFTISYSRPTQRFETLLSQFGWMLFGIVVACGLATALLAYKLSRAALRPLRHTAELIAQIDERHLDRRINADAMPYELVPMTRRLNEMLSRLEDVFHNRKQFLADAAHELRTPTAALLTTLEVALRRQRDSAGMIEAMQSALTDARRLRKLIEALMEQARSDYARGLDAMQSIEIDTLLNECVEIVRPLAQEKQITIDQDVPLGLTFFTRRDRLRSVVINLLSNAIQYNRTGGEIHLRCWRAADTSMHVRIKDTGRGITADQLPHVFEPFYRGGPGRGDDAEHLGLGLFLVRSHLEALRGACRVESEPGKGTTMEITLPELRSGQPSVGEIVAVTAPGADPAPQHHAI